ELADRRRLAGAVDADDEDHGGPVGVELEARRRPEERGDLVREREVQIAELLPLLESADELSGRGDADVGLQERFLEALPRRLVAGIECGDGEMLRER